jgi:formylglycine-generating enzyme required for sulfatase activity
MKIVTYHWEPDRVFEMVFVRGTHGRPFPFGVQAGGRPVEIQDFFIGTVPVTEGFWTHVMGTDDRAAEPALDLPKVNVSWDQITQPGGFLDRINQSSARTTILAEMTPHNGAFRLPSETEWEYAARGGQHWPDGFNFSGSGDIDTVAWYSRKHGDHTQPVARKAPNQLGIFDMSGNVWEWCHDVFTSDLARIPQDGTPFIGAGNERILRGGCFHNWAIHCTVSKRYQIERQFHDGCIGFRPVLAAPLRTG